MQKLVLLLCILCCISVTQADDRPMLGIFGGMNLNSMITDFNPATAPDLIPALNSEYKNELGLGGNMGIFAQFPISKIINFGLKFSVNNWSSELYNTGNEDVLLNSLLVPGEFERRLKMNLNYFSAEPNCSFQLYKGFHLYTGLGLNFPLYERAEYAEKVTSPDDATFDNNRWVKDEAIRNEINGRFDNMPSILLSANFGMYYDFPLDNNETFYITPAVYYNFGLTDYVKDISWRINQFHAEIALKYAFDVPNTKNNIIERFQIDTIEVSKPELDKDLVTLGKVEVFSSKLTSDGITTQTIVNRRTDTLFIAKNYDLYGSIYILGVADNGKEIKKPQFISEQFIDNRNQPLLNYIFFDSLNADIPERYYQINLADAKNFEIESLYKKSNIETYHNILNIIGYRMANNSEVKITLKGCNSHIGAEKWNEKLSQNRAQSVANYLTSVWGISADRIKIIAMELPENYSYPANQFEKAQENRRVEIYSDNYDMLSPIFINDTSVVNQPPKAKFIIEAKADAGFKNWKVNVLNRNEAGFTNIETNGLGKPPKELEINLQELVDEGFDESKPLYYSLQLSDKKDNEFKGREKPFDLEKISIQKKRTEKRGDMEIERFSLILFDFVSDELSAYNLRTIQKIKTIIKPNSQIQIIGHTDQLGNEVANRALSLKRAKAAYKALGRQDAKVEGRGEDEILYDNALPEGRIYSRTVDIIVATPVEYDK